MKSYSVPPDTREKERIVGGILTWEQTQYFILGVVLCAIVFVTISATLDSILGVILGLPLLAAGPVLAFMKLEGIPIMEYYRLRYRHRRKNLQLPYQRR
jgi:hypothetical protein